MPKKITKKVIQKTPDKSGSKKQKSKLKQPSKAGEAGMQVPYTIEEGQFGLGIFVQQNISKGSVVWKYKRGVNVRSFKGPKETRAFLDTLPTQEAKALWLDYAYHANGYMNEILDDGKYVNHST